MKKFARTLCVLMLVVVLGASCFALTACPGKTDVTEANEKKSLVFSSDELDNVFNPFFSTSGPDNDIWSNTQISMISADGNGNVYCGADEPTVALDYNNTIYYNDGSGLKAYSPEEAPDIEVDKVANIDPKDYYTTYQFLLKNNIRFSDGEPLTAKDVIFNLYTYLDPAYYGSSTIYSTDIVGLLDYRTQTLGGGSTVSDNMDKTINDRATQRFTNMRYAYDRNAETRATNRQNLGSQKASIVKDVDTVRKLYWNQIVSDYNVAVSGLETYLEENAKAGNEDKELGFTKVWEVFLYNEGFITASTKKDGTIEKVKAGEDIYDENGNKRAVGDKNINYGQTGTWWHDKDSLIKIVFNSALGLNGYVNENILYVEADSVAGDTQDDPRKPQDGKGPKVDIVKDEQGKAIGSTETGSTYENLLWDSNAITSNLYNIITYTGPISDIRNEFVGEEREKWFTENSSSGQGVDRIEGIKLLKFKAGEKFNGKMRGEVELDEDYYVLQIDVEKVDPKAIWNFSFNVAPMHYYSNTEGKDTNYGADVDYRAFSYPIYASDGTYLTSDPLYKGGTRPNASDKVNVGRPFGSKTYMDEVIKASDIISVPVGAGMYQVSYEDLQDEYYLFDKVGDEYKLKSNASSLRVKFTQFSRNNIVYFIRNPFFYTTSGESNNTPETSKICNCKIKFVRYQVISSSNLLGSIIKGTVHYGSPNASTENIKKINENKSIVNMVQMANNGYGYIGINPTYVPDLKVRQAIMTAMNIEHVKSYYSDFASLIYRPMSSVSWASPQNPDNPAYGDPQYDKPYYYDAKLTDQQRKDEINRLIREAGYSYNINDPNDVAKRTLPDGTEHKLEYTFTIAGSTDDHPAYTTMNEAANLLNQCGFKCQVKNDATALSKLASGTLTVWAAAWSATIDPDMYQVYHMDSSATSVRNWGYPSILNGDSKLYGDQKAIVEELSEYIDQARMTLNQEKRAEIYIKALDKVMELAVELPTYQRDNIAVYRSDYIDSSSLNQDVGAYRGPLAQMWKVSLK